MTIDLDSLEQTVRNTCALIDELRAERDELRRHHDELVQLVAEALEALDENEGRVPSLGARVDLRDWIKSARKAIVETVVQ